ncbi:hypothetical protein JRQ81_000311, partial [Phrynocephalus forsythii]
MAPGGPAATSTTTSTSPSTTFPCLPPLLLAVLLALSAGQPPSFEAFQAGHSAASLPVASVAPRRRGWFWGYEETRGLNLTCLSVQGSASVIAPLLLNISARSVMLDRAENLLHDHYGSKDYWDTRRSMVFARHLRLVGNMFRTEHLNSTDEKDRTQYDENWTERKVKLGTAKGGPYLGVHLRRKDFIWGHRNDVPSIQGAVKKIQELLKSHKLKKVFVATDAIVEETEKLKRLLPEMVRFEPTWEEIELYKDGGIAIIDQWICAHA